MNRRVPGPLKVLFFLALAALFLFILGNIIMFLWNTILVKVTGVNPLNLFDAIGLFILSRILVGSFRFGSRSAPWKKTSKSSHWRNKWMKMSDEDRQAFRKKWQERCGKKEN